MPERFRIVKSLERHIRSGFGCVTKSCARPLETCRLQYFGELQDFVHQQPGASFVMENSYTKYFHNKSVKRMRIWKSTRFKRNVFELVLEGRFFH